MKYDILALQAFQYTLEEIKKELPDCQVGICYHILGFYEAHDNRCHGTLGYEIVEWMNSTYFPSAHLGNYWWPVGFPFDCDHKELEDAKKKRILFLQRIIEDLMSGGPA